MHSNGQLIQLRENLVIDRFLCLGFLYIHLALELFENERILHLEGMILIRERRGLDFGVIILEGLSHDFADIGELLDEFWNKVCEHSKHVLIYQNLSIAAVSGADTDRRDTDLLRYQFCQRSRNAFQYDGDSIRVFSNESALCIRWPNYWSFSFKIGRAHV